MKLFQDSEKDVTGLGELSILYHLRQSVSVLHILLLTSPVSSLNMHLHWTFQPSSSLLREEKGTFFLSRPVWWQQQWCEREEQPSYVKPKGPWCVAWSPCPSCLETFLLSTLENQGLVFILHTSHEGVRGRRTSRAGRVCLSSTPFSSFLAQRDEGLTLVLAGSQKWIFQCLKYVSFL